MIKYQKLIIVCIITCLLSGCTTSTEVPAPVINNVIENNDLKGWKAGNLSDYITNYSDVEATIKTALNREDINIKQSTEIASDIGTLEFFGSGNYYVTINDSLDITIRCENHLASDISYNTGFSYTSTKINTSSIDNSNTNYTYIISSLSADEIVNKCKYYFENTPKIGQTYEEYYSTLEVAPVNPSNELYLKFGDNLNLTTTEDVIKYINYQGYQTEMDGTIGNSSGDIYISMGLFITDYNKATTIYEQLANIIKNNSLYIDNFTENKDSTTWYIIYNSRGRYLLTLTKSENGYDINIDYYRIK